MSPLKYEIPLMQQQAMLHTRLSRRTLSSKSTRLQPKAKACSTAGCYNHSRGSATQRADDSHNVAVAQGSCQAAKVASSTNLGVICGRPWLQAAALALLQLHLALAGHAADLVESRTASEGNIPSELSAAGEAAAPALSSLMAGSNRKQVEGCTRKCVPTCIRGGEGAPGLGPLSLRREIVVFKDGFRSRQYCLSECAQVCSLKINKDSSSSSSRSSRSSSSTSSGRQQQQQQHLSTSTASLGVP